MGISNYYLGVVEHNIYYNDVVQTINSLGPVESDLVFKKGLTSLMKSILLHQTCQCNYYHTKMGSANLLTIIKVTNN